MGQKIFRNAVLALTVAFILGCGTIFSGVRQEVSLNSTPDGATVKIEPTGQEVTTPATIKLKKKFDYTLTFTKEGYKPEEVTITRDQSDLFIVLDIFATGMIGMVVDYITGGWYKLDPSTVTVTLKKDDSISSDLPETFNVTIHLENLPNGGARVKIF